MSHGFAQPQPCGKSPIIKFGIVRRGARADEALRKESAHRGWWPFAYSLLSDLAVNYTPTDEALVERLYRSMRSGNGVYKITRRGRFDAFNATLADHIQKMGLATPVLRISDMAASSAITSLELFKILRDRFPVRFSASDWFDRIYIVSVARSAWKVVFDAASSPLQMEGCGLVLSADRPEPWRYPVNRAVQAIIKRRAIDRARTLLASSLRGDLVPPSTGSVETITLFHPEAVKVAKDDCRFALAREDLFAPRPDEFDVIRVMNALTDRHFPVDRVMSAISVVGANLREGGLLVLGRSVDEEDGRLRATGFVRRGSLLLPQFHAAEPFELASLVRDVRLSANPQAIH